MKKTALIVALSLAMALAVTGYALAREPMAAPGRSAPGSMWARSPLRTYYFLNHLKDELNLTENQLNKIKDLSFALEQKLLTLKAQNGQLRLERRKMFLADMPNYIAIEGNMNQSARNLNHYIIESMKARKQIEAVLTAEQQEQIKMMRKKWIRSQWQARQHRPSAMPRGRTY